MKASSGNQGISDWRVRLVQNLWMVPLGGVLAAILLAELTMAVERSIDLSATPVIGFAADVDSARSVLSTIAASMLTFTGLVFTLTIVAMQLATQFSSRLLGGFLSEWTSKAVLAYFFATFTYAVMILREVETGFVPEFSTVVAIVLVLASLIVFVYYLNQIAQSLRVANLVARAGSDARDEIDSAHGGDGAPGEEEREWEQAYAELGDRECDRVVNWPGAPGIAIAVDFHGIERLATELEATIELILEPGDFITEDMPIMLIYGAAGDEPPGEARIRGLIATGPERIHHQDPAFGLRQLADVACRALSPAVNDPTTARQALDQIHDLLWRLGSRCLASGVRRSDDGELRVVGPVHSWADLVHLGLDEVRQYGESSSQIVRRLRVVIYDLKLRLPECRTEALSAQLELLEAGIERGFPDRPDREWLQSAQYSRWVDRDGRVGDGGEHSG